MRRVKKLLGLFVSVLAILAITALAADTASAGTMYWLGGSLGGGSGTWDSISPSWSTTDGGGLGTWVNTSDTYFGGAIGGEVYISGFTPNVNSLSFGVGVAGISGYVITGGSLAVTTGSISVNSGLSEEVNSSIGGASGLTLNGGGTLVLSGANTYTGVTTIAAGSLSISSDANLGTPPTSPAAGSIVTSGGDPTGALMTTATFALNSKRGIVLGAMPAYVWPPLGNIDVASGTLTYGGVMADGITGTGGGSMASLKKVGAGTLVLSGANTYTGQTQVGPQWSGNGNGTLSVTGSIYSPAATISVTGGTLSIDGGTVTGSEVDVGIGGTQSAIAQGSGAFNAATLVVGYYTSDYTGFGCTYTLNGGTATISSTLWVGKEQGSGIFTQNGGVVTTNELIVGHNGGNGQFVLNSGAVSVHDGSRFVIGDSSALGAGPSSGTLTINGGAVTATMAVKLGWNNSDWPPLVGSNSNATGYLNINNAGSLTTSSDISIGDIAGGVGVLNLADSAVLNIGGNSYVGNYGTGTATLGGNATWNAGRLHVGEFGAGTLTQSGGVLNVTPSFGIVIASSGTGTFNLNGGVANLNAGNIQSGSGAAAFNFMGGTLKNLGLVSVPITLPGGGTGPIFQEDTGYSGTVAGNINGTGGLTKTGKGTLYFTGTNSYGGTVVVQGGTLDLAKTAQDTVTSMADIQAGKLIFDYTNAGDDPSSTIAAILKASHAAGWSVTAGHPIGSTTATDGLHALGWVDDTAHVKVNIMYTLYGDANLDGSVNGADLNTVLSNYNLTGMTWSQGDFNYDGTVNGADLNVVLSNYNQSLSVGTAVPEPSTIVLLLTALAAVACLVPMRRSR